MNDEKDCKIVFEGKNPDYPFKSADLPKALAYAKEKNWPILAIKTPWYWLSVMDEEVADSALELFK